MEKFSYIVKYSYYHKIFSDIMYHNDDYDEGTGSYFVKNGKEFIYLDIKDYNKILRDHNIDLSDFINKSYVIYILYRFMKNNTVSIERYRLIHNNHRVTVKRECVKIIPNSAFPDGYIYIATGYHNVKMYEPSYPITNWDMDKERLLRTIKSSSEYRNKDIIKISRISVNRFSFTIADTYSTKTKNFIYRYIRRILNNKKEYIKYVMMLTEGDNSYYDNQLRFLYNSSLYIDDSRHIIDEILDYDNYQELMRFARLRKIEDLDLIEIFSIILIAEV